MALRSGKTPYRRLTARLFHSSHLVAPAGQCTYLSRTSPGGQPACPDAAVTKDDAGDFDINCGMPRSKPRRRAPSTTAGSLVAPRTPTPAWLSAGARRRVRHWTIRPTVALASGPPARSRRECALPLSSWRQPPEPLGSALPYRGGRKADIGRYVESAARSDPPATLRPPTLRQEPIVDLVAEARLPTMSGRRFLRCWGLLRFGS